MKGACPPSSIDTFFTVSAHCRSSLRPTSVEPVKLRARTVGLLVRTSPIATASPVTTESTPLGIPASSASSASARAENGVSEAGRTTMVQPAASAAPALRVIMAEGKFQGVIAAATPTGSRTTSNAVPGRCDGMVSP
jgi:hypothetical protein